MKRSSGRNEPGQAGRFDPPSPKTEGLPRIHDFAADQAIEEISQDRLGRCTFAEKLAAAVCGWREKNSLVISLNGDWGSGKTSIKNLFKCYCRQKGDPYHVESNPWQWSGQDKIFEAFFHEIGIRLGKEDIAKQTHKLARKWRYFGAAWGLAQELTTHLKEFAAGVLLVSASFALFPHASLPGWLQSCLSILSVTGFVLGGLALAVPGLFEKAAAFLEAKAEFLQKDVEERRRDLSIELAKLDRPFVVVIDDLDRLTDEEIRLVFQLVKANSNLPRVVYLLLFQRDKVTKALAAVSGERGDEFLKKLVQVSFDIPEVPETRLHMVLIDGLSVLFAHPSLLKRWNKERWDHLFNEYLKSYFRTLRDVYRYLGSFSFTLECILIKVSLLKDLLWGDTENNSYSSRP